MPGAPRRISANLDGMLAGTEIRRAKLRFALLAGAVGLLVFLILFQQALLGSLLKSFTGAVENQSGTVLVFSAEARKNVSGSVILPQQAQQIASVVGEAAAEDTFSSSVLEAVDSVAGILTTPGIDLREMESRLAVGERKRWTPVNAPLTPSTPRSRQDRAAAAAARSGRALSDMIDASLSQLSSLEQIPLVEPVQQHDEDAVVPVETLLYRGQAALERGWCLMDLNRQKPPWPSRRQWRRGMPRPAVTPPGARASPICAAA